MCVCVFPWNIAHGDHTLIANLHHRSIDDHSIFTLVFLTFFDMFGQNWFFFSLFFHSTLLLFNHSLFVHYFVVTLAHTHTHNINSVSNFFRSLSFSLIESNGEVYRHHKHYNGRNKQKATQKRDARKGIASQHWKSKKKREESNKKTVTTEKELIVQQWWSRKNRIRFGKSCILIVIETHHTHTHTSGALAIIPNRSGISSFRSSWLEPHITNL